MAQIKLKNFRMLLGYLNSYESVRKAFQLWRDFPFHPSLHFKCVDRSENLWSLRVTLGYRVLALVERDEVIWFWVGDHKDYERFF